MFYTGEFVVVEVFVQFGSFHAIAYFEQIYWSVLEIIAFLDCLQCKQRMGLSFIGQNVNILEIRHISIENNRLSPSLYTHHVNNLKYDFRNIEFKTFLQVLQDIFDV